MTRPNCRSASRPAEPDRAIMCGVAKLLLLVAFALIAGCSSGSSAAVRDKRVCAAYETFWDTGYSGGKPSTTMLAREQKLLDAIAHAHDKKLGAAAKAVVDGEL